MNIVTKKENLQRKSGKSLTNNPKPKAMKRKINNLEAYYNYLQKDGFMKDVKFNDLPASELLGLEVSEGFRKFLIRGIWNKILIRLAGISIPLGIILTAYLKNS